MHLSSKAASMSLDSLYNMCIYQEQFVGAYRLSVIACMSYKAFKL